MPYPNYSTYKKLCYNAAVPALASSCTNTWDNTLPTSLSTCQTNVFSREKTKMEIRWRPGQRRQEEGDRMESDKMVITEKHWLCRGISRAGTAPFLQHMVAFGHLKDEKNQHRDPLLHLPPHRHHHCCVGPWQQQILISLHLQDGLKPNC